MKEGIKLEKDIRVVHITSVHHPYDPRIYYKQCMSLQNHGYDVTLIAQDVPGNTTANTEIKHVRLKSYKGRIKRMLFGVRDAYKKAKALDADIYVFHDPELIYIGAKLKKKNNIVIYDIHEDYVTSILQKEYLHPLLRRVFATAYKMIEKIFTRKMEKSLAEKYYKDMYPKGTCILNYPLMNEKFMAYDRTAGPLVNKLLYTGNVKEDRGAITHGRLPKIDPEVEVQFVGKCATSVAEKIFAAAGKHRDRVHIMGIDEFIIKEDMEAMYVKENWLAGIALFPPTEHYMKKELTKFFEYMNVGLPIICSDFPVWKEFVETYECGIAVDPYNEEEIYEAIELLRNNPSLALQMGENGKRAIAAELNWQIEEEKLLAWYDQLLKGVK